MMNQGDRVRIVKVTSRARAMAGAGSPRVGDIGVIRCALKNSWHQLCGYLVDGTRADGSAPWVADFAADEVEVAREEQNELVALALAHAKELVAQAKANGHVRGIGDEKFCWLAADRADAHADLLRAAGLAAVRKGSVEHFQPVADGEFWAQLDAARSDKGIARLHFRMSDRYAPRSAYRTT